MSKLPIWKRLVIVGSVTKAFDLDNMLTKEELFAVIFEKQSEMEKQSADMGPGLIQAKIFSSVLRDISEKPMHSPEWRSLLSQAGSTSKFLSEIEVFNQSRESILICLYHHLKFQ